MAPSGKGYSPPIPGVLRSTSREGLPLSQPPQTQPSNWPLNMSSRSSRNISPTFPNLVPRSASQDLNPRPVSGTQPQTQTQPQPRHISSRASSRTQSRVQSQSSSRPLLPRISLSRPRDLVPRPRLTSMDSNVTLGPGQGQFQAQLQSQLRPHINSQSQNQNQGFYTNFPPPFTAGHSPVSHFQTTTSPANGYSHQGTHRALHPPQPPTQVHSETRTQNQGFYSNLPSPFPTAHSPFSQFQMNTEPGDRELHRGTHQDLVQAPSQFQAPIQAQNETFTRANKRARLSYSHSNPNSSMNADGSERRNEHGTANRTRTATGNQSANHITTQDDPQSPDDTFSESPLSTPPDSVSTSPPLFPPRSLPRFGSFRRSQRLDQSPGSRTRALDESRNRNRTENVIGTGDGRIIPPLSSNLSIPASTPYTEPPVLSSNLDIANRPTVAQKRWMYAVRKEGRRNDRNENGGYSRGIEGQVIRLFGDMGEGGVS
ncbi:hypothetical protein BOTCAL_1341g00010 [Botryotinia calthae]|uniref:Uncharacterized protein n=1 Tax=Botryotinia calthae TaxID=38488 RepID=A0A4Y8CCE8_9HELO|nr:hypothetical protein BOTCAL_1341g00010 [Botryotinia calthae]